ncbi:hypothetical protein ABW19_dt0207515 [Dactylella cylindrospora]|nr:hypothetical protein ABW19_dt0207515 [Dactylella cylindrospora]
MSGNYGGLSATQHALLLPEILSLVLEWINEDTYYELCVYEENPKDPRYPQVLSSIGNKGVLSCCCRVNKLWFQESVRFLWRDPSAPGAGWKRLPDVFRTIEPGRKQMYANYIEECLMGDIYAKDNSVVINEELEGLEFPNMKRIRIMLMGRYSMHIPRLGKNATKELELDPRFEYHPDTYYVNQEALRGYLNEIVEIFPDLETLEFSDRCLAYPGDLEGFASRMRKLKRFDHSHVWVGHGYPPSST